MDKETFLLAEKLNNSTSMKKTENNNLTSFEDHLYLQYGKIGTPEREKFGEGVGRHLRMCIRNLFVVGAGLLLFDSQIFCQPWFREPSLESSIEDINFYDITAAFNTWAEGKDIHQIKGYKQFKRWEWFNTPRVYPSGKMPDPSINWKEWQKTKSETKAITDNADWVSISPSTLPPSLDENSIHGMGRVNCIAFHPTDTNTLFVGASQGGVWKSTDNGGSWTNLTDGLPILRISAITVDPNDPNTIYIGTGDIDYVGFPTISLGRKVQYGIGLMKSVNGGATWDTTGFSFELTEEDNSLIREIVIKQGNSNELLVAGPCGVFRSGDAGASWTRTSYHKVIDVEVNPLNDNTIYFSTFFNPTLANSKRIYKTTNFGDGLTELSPGIPISGAIERVAIAIAPSDTSVIYALATGGSGGTYGVFRTTNAGASWMQTLNTSGLNILGWADGGYFHTKNSYIPDFDTAGQGSYDLTLVVDPMNAGKVYSGGVNMWGSIDSGYTWDVVSMWVAVFGESIHADQHFSKYHPVTRKFYQSNDGGIFTTNQINLGSLEAMYGCIDFNAAFAAYMSGQTPEMGEIITPNCYELPTQWTDISGGLHITEYYRLATCQSNPEMIVGGAQDNGTYKYRNGQWVNTFGGDGMEAMIHHYNDSIYYVTNYNGSLSKTIDGGVTYTSGLDSAITQAANESGDWVTPFVMHPTNPEVIYGAFENVWQSLNGGATWSKLGTIGSSYSLRALAVAPSNPSYIYTSTNNNIWVTKDNGGSWASIYSGLPNNMITYIAVDEANPERVWVSMSGYSDGQKVFSSTDAGANWVNCSGNLSNVSVNCVVFQKVTSNIPVSGIYVGTDIGVYYTNDSLSQQPNPIWILHCAGLPNVIVNELEIHYGAEKLRAATYGRGFWETSLVLPTNGIEFSKETNRNIIVYPNPNNGSCKVEASFEGEENICVTVFSLTGDILYQSHGFATGSYSQNIDLNRFPVGTYIVQVSIKNSHYTRKIVKQ